MKVTRKVDGGPSARRSKPAYAGFAKEFGADNIKKIQEVK